jgi:hypothetical protein
MELFKLLGLKKLSDKLGREQEEQNHESTDDDRLS